jgi:hypothetical protein
MWSLLALHVTAADAQDRAQPTAQIVDHDFKTARIERARVC